MPAAEEGIRGVCVAPRSRDETRGSVLERANDALYKSKKAGRKRVTLTVCGEELRQRPAASGQRPAASGDRRGDRSREVSSPKRTIVIGR